jgi:hypothetical protein
MKSRDIRFDHMEAVFMPTDRDKPNLPFSEYIVEHGQHQIVRGHSGYKHHYIARYNIPRKDVLIEVSVISGSMFYCRPDAPYEVMVANHSDDVRGYMTDEELMILLAKLITEGDADGI